MTTPTLPEPVSSFFEAVHSQDEDAFLGAFTDDGSVDDWGRVFTGRAQIKAWSDKEFLGSAGRLAVQSVEAEDGRVTVVGDWSSSYANGRSAFTFDLLGDRIRRMTIREG